MIIWGSGITERYREKHNYSQFILFSLLNNLTIKIIIRKVLNFHEISGLK